MNHHCDANHECGCYQRVVRLEAVLREARELAWLIQHALLEQRLPADLTARLYRASAEVDEAISEADRAKE